MIKYLLSRPLGTSVVVLTLVCLGVLVSRLLPISLLPPIPAPQITIHAPYPNANAKQINELISLPLRNQLLQLSHLENIEVISSDGLAVAKLRFEYGRDLDLSFLETNEKIDYLMQELPVDSPRPRAIKAGATDIPIFHVNVTPKSENYDFIRLSNFCKNTVKRRLEQLDEVGLVDISGLAVAELSIQLDKDKIEAIGSNVSEIIDQIKLHTERFGSITIRDGNYEYDLRFETSLNSIFDIENTQLRIKGNSPRIVRLSDVCKIAKRRKKDGGLYNFNGKRSITMSVIKQGGSQLFELKKRTRELLSSMEKEYPDLLFSISENQTELLDLSITNLVSSILWGALLSIIMVTIFMNRWQNVVIVACVIPISISITLLSFYVFGISINIVSLAGLLLGMGEIIDSSIIIIESIEEQIVHSTNRDTDSFDDACCAGPANVIRPLFTSVLTNSAVFVPLLFLSGIAGALFYDQALAVTLSLGTSLLVSYFLVPLLYNRFYRRSPNWIAHETRAFILSKRVYDLVFDFSVSRRKVVVIVWLLILTSSFVILSRIKRSGMPQLNRDSLEILVHWNENISNTECERRLLRIFNDSTGITRQIGMYVGAQSSFLTNRLDQTDGEAMLRIKLRDPENYSQYIEMIRSEFRRLYPQSSIVMQPSLNVFEQLFDAQEPEFQVRISGYEEQSNLSVEQLRAVVDTLVHRGFGLSLPKLRQTLSLKLIDYNLELYGIKPDEVVNSIQLHLNSKRLDMLNIEQENFPVVLGLEEQNVNLGTLLNTVFVRNDGNESIPISKLVEVTNKSELQNLYMDEHGAYVPLMPAKGKTEMQIEINEIDQILSEFNDITYRFGGRFIKERKYLSELSYTVVIAVLLLFFILAAQFESLLQPFIVLLTICFGFAGGVTLLYLTGSSLNIMSAIGIIVLIGLLDNDSILKIDTMNKLAGEDAIVEGIKRAGQQRLLSQLMTFLTTILAMLPVLWSQGLGADLQRPLALVVIGGMILGVLISWSFVPLAFLWIYNRSRGTKS